ncbi:hypothetical protein [Methylobacter svalbardensis]|uniref:hypothetical protein n=1 Tax=Methylobacter svalbardensis TaxID=3080016 RepID=UPI0030EE8B1D
MQPSISLTNFIRCTPPPAAIPDVGFNFSQPIKDNVEETVSGVHGKGVLKIYGPDLEEMRGALEEAKTVLTNVIDAIDLGLYRGRRSYRLNWIARDPGLQRL